MSASPTLVTGDYISHAGETELDFRIFFINRLFKIWFLLYLNS